MMFARIFNQALITAELAPDGPVLIKEGGVSLDPAAPEMAFVRTWRGGRATVYLPGSSLKGVLRAHGERLLATALGPDAAEDPFQFDLPRRQAAREARKPEGTPAVYRRSCEADRLFGSTEIASRFRIADAYPTAATLDAANRTEVRYEVQVDRPSQAGKNPRELEGVTDGRFALSATLENFELWMLALVLQSLDDLEAGLLQIGHGKSRGRGAVKLFEPSVSLRWLGRRPERLQGTGASAPLREGYGLSPKDSVEPPPGAKAEEAGLFAGYRFTGWPVVRGLRDALAPAWLDLVERSGRNGDGA
jgi:CRISPR/Cas system CSM-associated protein Csm3 (group 7 of RAMP superfamily)